MYIAAVVEKDWPAFSEQYGWESRLCGRVRHVAYIFLEKKCFYATRGSLFFVNKV